MSVTGVVTNPASPYTSSATLLTDVSSGATVLPVDDAGVFAEDFSEARFLVIGAEQTPREYVAVQNDEDDPAGESVTLLDPVGGSGFEAGLTVSPWDPDAAARDKRGVEFAVWVQPDGADAPVSVSVPHQWLPTSGDTDALLSARVRIEETRPDEWTVAKVFGRQAAFNRMEFGQITSGPMLFSASGATDETFPAALYILALTDSFGAPFNEIHLSSGTYTVSGVEYSQATVGVTAGNENFGSTAFLEADVVRASTLDIIDLADGGVRNLNSGTKYVRAGSDGALFASTSAPSSRLIKHDIQPLEIDAEALLSLQPVTFRYNEAPDIVRAGFIAEDADELGLNLWVGYEDRDDPDQPTGFDYDGFVPALLALVQQQQQQIADLTERVAALETD